jgi:hypothetical protein
MLGVFCLRLAFGLLASLLPLWPFPLNPRFYRAHFLTALGLTCGALIFLNQADLAVWCSLLAALILCALGSMAWSLEHAPGGRALIVLGTLAAGAALFFFALIPSPDHTSLPLVLAEDFSSSALLGAATTSMLLGHSYLIAPGLTVRPLLRALLVLGACLLLRCVVAGAELWSWTEVSSSHSLDTEVVLWLAVRWTVGLVAPLVLGWMAWEAAKIRSTQSATGILYVAVICCFLGELTGQLFYATMMT